VNTIGGLIGSVKESEIFHFGLLYFCMHSTILKLQIAISMVCNCSLDETILELIKQLYMFVELEVTTNGPHMFYL
jgi:hypothetical protein